MGRNEGEGQHHPSSLCKLGIGAILWHESKSRDMLAEDARKVKKASTECCILPRLANSRDQRLLEVEVDDLRGEAGKLLKHFLPFQK